MQITFWGVRGSIPAPGPETNKYGGNTSCVELRDSTGQLVVVDAGTGLIGLGRSLMSGPFGRGEGWAPIVLSHTHWDHIQGFPFFVPVFVGGNRFTVFGPGRSEKMLEGILEGQMNPHFSPLYTMKNLGADIDLRAVAGDGSRFQCAGFSVTSRDNPHGTTRALAFRFEENGRSLVYASDAGYAPGGPTTDLRNLYRDADMLIHDSTYTPEDRAARLDRGLSSVADAVSAAVSAQVKRLVLFHFDQDYSDEQVDGLLERARRMLDEQGGSKIEVIAAHEGLTLTL